MADQEKDRNTVLLLHLMYEGVVQVLEIAIHSLQDTAEVKDLKQQDRIFLSVYNVADVIQENAGQGRGHVLSVDNRDISFGIVLTGETQGQ